MSAPTGAHAGQQIALPFDPGALWLETQDGNPTVQHLLDRHYSHRRHRNRATKRLFCGPGHKIVLVSPDGRSCLVWRRSYYPTRDGQSGVCCAAYRSEGNSRGLLASDLLRAGMEIAWQRWPGQRLFTYIDPRHISSANPGYCFKVLGWRHVGYTIKARLHVLEICPPGHQA